MHLKLTNLLPAYFAEERKASSDIWGKDLLWPKGERVQIVAPSGSGKTSLIHFLYGLRKEYSGQIGYGSQAINSFDAEAMAIHRRNHLSVVLQDLRLFPDRTVEENLYIKQQLQPFEKASSPEQMTASLGIAGKLSSLCRNCSYGEQQRVAIIRALLQPFDILLLDEPFSHLDQRNAEKAMQLILDEADRRQATIVLADLEEVSFFPHTKLYHL